MAAPASTSPSAGSKRRRDSPDSVPTIIIDDHNDDDVVVLYEVKNKRHKAAATTTDIDLNLVFELQMEEAIAASNSATATATTTTTSNQRPGKAPMSSEEVIVIPDDDDCYEIPYGSGSCSECFTLCFKGLILEDTMKRGAIALVIFDSNDVEVKRFSEALILPEDEMTDEIAQLEAFTYGLEVALNLNVRNVKCTSIDFHFDPFLNLNQKPKEDIVGELVQQAINLRKRFQRCRLFKNENKAQLALELAKSCIASQIGRHFLEIIRENCLICMEDVDSKKMTEIGSCQHRFCSSCIQHHIQFKVQGREIPRCPQPNCGLELSIDACKKFLTQKLYDIFAVLVKESLIPTTDKLYCPNPRCSHLMSKTEVLANNRSLASTSTAVLTACKCSKCNKLFCINCKVLWHSNESCDEYKKRELDPRSAEGQLKHLAREKKWRQCPKCSHMVELAHGCYHISCRCGHEFCYVCGREWKNKAATCSCPLWTEENIIHQGFLGHHAAQIAHGAHAAFVAHGAFVANGAPHGAHGAPHGAHGAPHGAPHGAHGGWNMQYYFHNYHHH